MGERPPSTGTQRHQQHQQDNDPARANLGLVGFKE
jgi:hypothetical protein